MGWVFFQNFFSGYLLVDRLKDYYGVSKISQFYLLTFILRFSLAILSFCSEEVGLLFLIMYISFGFIFLFILKVI